MITPDEAALVAMRIAVEVCDSFGVAAPGVIVAARAVGDPAQASYAARSRTISITYEAASDPKAVVDVLAHELTHHLDNVVGRRLTGEPRGRHGPDFYEREDAVRLEVVAAIRRLTPAP